RPPRSYVDLRGFTLLDTATDRVRKVADLEGTKGIVLFISGNSCRVAVQYETALTELRRPLGEKDISLVEVNAKYNETPAHIRTHASELRLDAPIYKDVDARLADAVGATRTSEAILIDKRGAIVYRGRIDDRFAIGVRRERATRHDLLDAVAAMTE